MIKYHNLLFLIQARGFISLAKLGGGVWLTTETCLRQTARLFSTAGLPNRGHTHQGLLWSLVEARALLLEATKEKKEAIRPCQELSGLLATCGLEKNNQLREMKMRVSQKHVIMQSHFNISFYSIPLSMGNLLVPKALLLSLALSAFNQIIVLKQFGFKQCI